MSLQVDYIYETDFTLSEIEQKRLEQLLQMAATMEGRASGELSLTFCDNNRIQEMNRTFRGIDRATDVLSFPMDDEDLLGDIVISIPIAQEQANEYGHSFERELFFLVLHGFLHLLGYDHKTEEEEKVMFAKQEHILTEMGITR